MTSWREVILGDLCTRVTVGHVGKMADEYVAEGIPFLRSQNIKPFEISPKGLLNISETFHRKLGKSMLNTGDVVVIRTGYPGTAAVIPGELDGSNCADLVVISPSAALNPHVLAAVFNSAWGRSAVGGQLVGSAQQHFNVGSAKALRFRLPDRPEQDRIAAVLCALNDLIANSQRRAEVLEEMARAIYREWFVSFRHPGHEDLKVVDSPLGAIPDGWEVRPFSETASFVNGFAFKPSHWSGVGRPIIKIKQLKQGVAADTPRCEEGEVHKKFWVEQGDLLFSWSADLGVYRWAQEPGLLNQHLFTVQPSGRFSRAFLFFALDEAMPQFWARAQGTTMRHIKRSALSEVATVAPGAELIDQFTDTVEPMAQEVITLTQSAAHLAAIRDLLLPKLVSGELDVSALDLTALLAGGTV